MMSARLGWGLTILALGAAPLLLPEFYVTLLNYIGLNSLVVLGLVLLTGVGGLTSFGQAAFVGLGAYTSGYLSTVYGISPWLGLVAGVALTLAVAWVIAAVTLRMAGHYLPLGTMAWGISFYYLYGNIEALGGHTGMTDLSPIELFGITLDTGRKFFGLIWLCVLAAIVAVSRLLDSRTGRAIRALRGGQSMAESFGVDTHHMKVIIFLYSALLAGLSGWLYAHMLRFINPTPFSLHMGMEYLFMAVIGGAGYVWGAVVGASILTLLNHWLQDLLPRVLGHSGDFERLVFGLLMVLLLQYAREGAMHQLRRLFPARKIAAEEPPPIGEVSGLPKRSKPQSGESLLTVNGVSKNFGGLLAVHNIGFTVKAGEIVGLIGPNGAGKTTIFNLITGELPLSEGHIHFRDQRINGQPARVIAGQGIARSFQHAHLLVGMSVLENVMLGAHLRGEQGLLAATLQLDRPEEARLRAEATRQLQRVGLGEHLHELAGNLALGQQRLLEIARALCADPLLILLDEPAAGLRFREKQALAGLIAKLRQEGLGVLLVEHDMDFVMNLVDRLVVMDFGEKIAEGVPHDVQRDPAVIEAYLGGVDEHDGPA